MNSRAWVQCDAEILAPPRRPDVVEETLDNETVLFDPVNAQIHRLNETATIVWNLCDGDTTTRQIAEKMTQAYDVEYGNALDYVEQLVAWLAQSSLVELRAA